MSAHPEPPKLPRWVPAFALALAALALSLFAWWPIIAAHPKTQNGDGPFYFKVIEAARITITRFHEFPHWNPYECGGVALWDNPQAPLASPILWATFLIGTTRTIQLWYVLHSAMGFIAMWLFARHDLKLGRAATFAASAIWAFAGFHHQHYMGGHFTFVPFLYFPFGLLIWRRAEHDLRYAVGLGLLVAWMMFEGGVYPIPHLAVVLVVEGLLRLFTRDDEGLRAPHLRALRMARGGALAGVVALGVGAVRFLPVIDQLKVHTRGLPTETDALQWQTFLDMFVARSHEWTVARQTYVWGEYAAYVGPLVLLLALVGVFFVGSKRWWLLGLLAFCGAVMFGMASKYAPYAFLKQHVYPFKEMRVPSRFRCEVTMVLAALCGIAIEEVSGRARRWFARLDHAEAVRLTMLSVALIAAGDIISLGISRAEAWWTSAPAAPLVVPSPNFYYGGPGLADFLDQPRQNRGRLTCWEEWGFGQGAPLWEGDLPQARAADDGAEVKAVTRTPNTFVLDVVATRPSKILLNGVYDPNFHTNLGTLHNENKQLVLEVPEGTHHVVVKCWPRRFVPGVVLTFVSIAAVTAFFIWEARRRRRLSLTLSGSQRDE